MKHYEDLADAFHQIHFRYIRKYRLNKAPWQQGDSELMIRLLVSYARVKRATTDTKMAKAYSVPADLDNFLILFHKDIWQSVIDKWSQYQFKLAETELVEIQYWIKDLSGDEEDTAEFLNRKAAAKHILELFLNLDDINCVQHELIIRNNKFNIDPIYQRYKEIFTVAQAQIKVKRRTLLIPADSHDYKYWVDTV